MMNDTILLNESFFLNEWKTKTHLQSHDNLSLSGMGRENNKYA